MAERTLHLHSAHFLAEDERSLWAWFQALKAEVFVVKTDRFNFKPGELLARRYEVIRLLGAGTSWRGLCHV